jgi:3-hydroxyacyl-CoA dehydrogenase
LNRRVAIIGAGTIGRGWAVAFAAAGWDVRIHDASPGQALAAPATVQDMLRDLLGAGLLASEALAGVKPVMVCDTLEDAVCGADWVQECVAEDVSIKAEVFVQIEKHVLPDTILASSSSAIVASKFASDLASRHRVLVAHPANPAHVIPIVELVPAPFTDPGMIEHAAMLLRGIGKKPVVLSREVEGFLFNRLQGAVLREAYWLFEQGLATMADIDEVVKNGLATRWSLVGPFETSDLNYRGGLKEHGRRMAPAYARMGRQSGSANQWPQELIDRAHAARRELLAEQDWAARADWRDRTLMKLFRFRAALEDEDQPTWKDA